ncbi:MAG: GlsB/YeaQ/YmgE family stress response membrane protein [Herpetosiphonaceae bacterium]|nr:GlsB/YeaQ/YmgE family stress response membrane protein [Herpetosiphonaceae bacterium]
MTFTLLGFIIMLVIAAVCGALGQAIAGYTMGGLLVSIAVGFIGALVGIWLAGQLGLPEIFSVNVEGQPFPIVWSIIGATLFALLVSFLRSPRYRRRRRA